MTFYTPNKIIVIQNYLVIFKLSSRLLTNYWGTHTRPPITIILRSFRRIFLYNYCIIEKFRLYKISRYLIIKYYLKAFDEKPCNEV